MALCHSPQGVAMTCFICIVQESEVVVAIIYELGEGASESAFKPGSGPLSNLSLGDWPQSHIRCWCMRKAAGPAATYQLSVACCLPWLTESPCCTPLQALPMTLIVSSGSGLRSIHCILCCDVYSRPCSVEPAWPNLLQLPHPTSWSWVRAIGPHPLLQTPMQGLTSVPGVQHCSGQPCPRQATPWSPELCWSAMCGIPGESSPRLCWQVWQPAICQSLQCFDLGESCLPSDLPHSRLAIVLGGCAVILWSRCFEL